MPRSKTGDDARSPSPPQDSGIDARVKDATIHVVAEKGFAGLDVEAICARAGVSTAAFHQRWPDASAAMLDALDDRARLAELPDEGSLLGDLTAYACAYLKVCAEPSFVAFMFYLLAETKSDPDLLKKLGPGFIERRTRNRALIERAVARGELPADADGDAILDAVLGQCLAWMGQGNIPPPDDIRRFIAQLIAPASVH
jgi:AcrR family transcriptional regulator